MTLFMNKLQLLTWMIEIWMKSQLGTRHAQTKGWNHVIMRSLDSHPKGTPWAIMNLTDMVCWNLPINKQNGEWGHPLKDGLPPWCSLHKELMMIRWLSQLYNECIITNVTDNPNTTCLWMNFTSLRCFALCGVLPLISPRLKEFIKGLLPPQKKLVKYKFGKRKSLVENMVKKNCSYFPIVVLLTTLICSH